MLGAEETSIDGPIAKRGGQTTGHEAHNNHNSSAPLSQDPTETPTNRPISCPLVLQCANCRTIVGDTCAILDLNSDLRTITIQSKPFPRRADMCINIIIPLLCRDGRGHHSR